VSRRGLLRASGAALAGVGLLTGTAAAGHDDDPEYPSAAWFEREQRNYARTREEPTRQANDPTFQARLEEQSNLNRASLAERQATEQGWNSAGNLCAQYSEQCCGDPFMYPATEPIYEGDAFYEDARRRRVAFLDTGVGDPADDGGARLSGHVWAPAEDPPPNRDGYPGVVITNGSVQAPEPLYWWFARTLVDAGYVVLTFDPRGQGRSNSRTPGGTQGSNAHPQVFVTNQIDAIDFFRSTPEAPYEPNVAGTDLPDVFVDANPFHEVLDRSRLGIAGHSLGAGGVSVVQGLGADGSGVETWPGSSATDNPVDVALAWDNLSAAGTDLVYTVQPRVPAMGHSADYGLTPTPKQEPPNAEAHTAGYDDWQAAGLSTYQITVRGGTHYEWSRIPTFPATDWEAWGNELADYLSLAWFDRWLKRPGEAGWRDATARLTSITDDPWVDRLSFYYRSAYDFAPGPDAGRGRGRERDHITCADLTGGCGGDDP